jgi:hypothetical protein
MSLVIPILKDGGCGSLTLFNWVLSLLAIELFSLYI